MEIILYKYGKRENSTARPTGGAAYQCRLKTDCSVVSPTIEIDMGSATAWPDYNYAFIDTFHRYYSISNITASKGIWILQLDTDVLATYKPIIGDYGFYTLRSSAESDGSIIDTYYPASVNCTKVLNTAGNPWVHAESGVNVDVDRDGCFILGIVSTGFQYSNYGSLAYFAFNRENLLILIRALINNIVTNANGFLVADAQLALQKAIVDPISYIKTALWIPQPYDNLPAADEVTTGIDINGWSLTGITYKKVTGLYHGFTWSFNISKHPQAAARGAWLNASPYTRMNLFIPPFGMFELDPSVLINESILDVRLNLDYITGMCTMIAEGHANKADVAFSKTMCGVPIAISQITHDVISGGAGFVSNMLGLMAGAATGNAVLTAAGAIGTVGSAIDSLRPHAASIGGTGAFTELCGMATLYHYFMEVAPESNDEVGRPLCKIRKPSAIPGYIQVLHGDCPIPGTKGEQEKIRQYMEAGFYYE